MASGYSHILITKWVRDALPGVNEELDNIIDAGQYLFQLGAVAPDLPYASIADGDLFLSNESKVADFFHYYHTNQIPLRALDKLKNTDNIDFKYAAFAFFTGYLSHVIIDGLVHPFVRDMVGDYEQNQAAHRSLEMAIDVLLYDYFTRDSGEADNLRAANLYKELKSVDEETYKMQIFELFSYLICNIYSDEMKKEKLKQKDVNSKKIDGWKNGLMTLFKVAETNVPRIYFIEKLQNSFFFQDSNEVLNDPEKYLLLTPEKVQGNDNKIFNNSTQIHFINDILPKIADVLTEALQISYNYVFENGPRPTEITIPQINLDTGRSLAVNGGKNLNEMVKLWS